MVWNGDAVAIRYTGLDDDVATGLVYETIVPSVA